VQTLVFLVRETRMNTSRSRHSSWKHGGRDKTLKIM